MRFFGLSDLHLSFSGAKPMDVFGPWWAAHSGRVEAAWRATVADGDVVCLPGDLCWATRLHEAAAELAWLGSLPGEKVLVRGNHDYWWDSVAKVRASLPRGVHAIQNDALSLGQATIGGARGWVDHTLDFSSFPGHAGAGELDAAPSPDDAKIYAREVGRLRSSLERMNAGSARRIALLHFPPTSPAMEDTPVTEVLEAHGVDTVVFGHVHMARPAAFRNPFGVKRGATYYLASADYAGFAPVALDASIDGSFPSPGIPLR